MNADFVDTNIVIYCVSDDEAKRSKAQALLARRPTLSALNIVKRYHCSIYDSLIIAAALSANCTTLYSEDMQHRQIIENQLTIINPFIGQS